MLPLDPSEWPIVSDNWSKDWKKWAKWQPTPYCHSTAETAKTVASDAPDLHKLFLCSYQGKKNTSAEAASCLNASLRSAATQPHSLWASPAEKALIVLQAGQAIHCTQPKYLCHQLPQYNLEISSFVMILPKGRVLAKIDVIWQTWKTGKTFLLSPFCELHTLQFSFPMQHKSGDLRDSNHICQAAMSVFLRGQCQLANQPEMLILPHTTCLSFSSPLSHGVSAPCAPAALQEGALHLLKN